MTMNVKNNYGGYTKMNAATHAGRAKHKAERAKQAKAVQGGKEESAVTLEISEQARQIQEKQEQGTVDVQEKTAWEAPKDAVAQGNQAQVVETAQAEQGMPSFSTTKDLMNYLKENYNVVRQGMASISGKYLRACLTDEDKLKKLFDNLAAADEMDADSRENLKGYQGMKVKIDENGDMETETHSGWVGFNEAKRARQLAAAKTQANVQSVMAILQQDLAECQAGKEKGMCDDETIGRVQAMLASAQQRMAEVAGEPEEEDPAAEQAFLMSSLM